MRRMPVYGKRIVGLLVVLLSAAQAGYASGGRGARKGDPNREPPPESTEVHLSSVQQLPHEVTQATLSNGLTVLVQENHVAPVATARCFVKNTGSAYEGRWDGAGLSHVLEHVVAGGTTTKRTEKQIEDIINSFGGQTNAFTSTDMTVFYIDSPAKNVMTAIELVADSMQHVIFEPKEFARELKVVRRELADGENEREQVLNKLLNQTLYTLNPVRNPIIGYLSVLNRTSNQTIIDFYHERYIPQNQIFVVVGDVNTKDVLDQVLKQWQGHVRGPDTVVNLPDEPEQLAPREMIHEMEGSTYDLALAWPTVTLADKDMYALDVAAYILSEGDSSRLVRGLKYEKQLVLSVNSASYTPQFVRGWFGVFADCEADKWKKAEAEILGEVYRLSSEPVGAAELARAKKQKAAEVVFQAQTVQESADSLGRSYIAAADPLFDHHYVDEIQKVTAEQIRDVARRYLVPQRLNRVIITPPGGGPKLTHAESAAGETPMHLEKLPNGLRVLVKRQANLPLVNIQAFALCGALADTPQTAGRAALVADMLDKGTAAHSGDQIGDYFDSVGGKFEVSAGRNTIYATASVLRDDYPQSLALLAECFTASTFPEVQFERVKRLDVANIEHRDDEPRTEIVDLFHDHLPAASAYHIIEQGTLDSVGRLTAADLKAFHAKYFVPNNMIVTVFGDVDVQAALKLVTQHFGSLKADPSFTPPSFDRPNAIAAAESFHKQTSKATGMVVMGYTNPSIFNREDYAAMQVVQTILSGYGAPSGWLFHELRGEGLVYWVTAQQMTGPAPGFFVVMAQTQPDKVQEVVARITKNLDKAKSGDVSSAEFEAAKQQILALHAQENTTIESQARLAALDELYGLGYDYDQHFEARLQAVSKDAMVAVVRKYLGNRILVTTSPEAK